MIFICQAASKSAELCCWLLCKGPKSEDMLLKVIINELGKQFSAAKAALGVQMSVGVSVCVSVTVSFDSL